MASQDFTSRENPQLRKTFLLDLRDSNREPLSDVSIFRRFEGRGNAIAGGPEKLLTPGNRPETAGARPTETSTAAVRYVRNTWTPAVR
jgi:hypothetical protein